MWTGMEFVRMLQDIRFSVPDAVDGFFAFVSSYAFNVAIPMVMICYILWFVDKRGGLLLSLNYSFSMLFAWIVKGWVRQPRPWELDPEIDPYDPSVKGKSTYSFPSGHTASVLSSYGTAAAIIRTGWFRAFCIVMMILVPFSRMFLGMHTPADILGSVAVVIAVCAVNHIIIKLFYDDRRIILAIYTALTVAAAALCMAVGGDIHYITPCGICLGTAVGTFLEDRYVGYSIPVLSVKKAVLRLVLGMMIMLVLFGIPYLFHSDIGTIIGGFLTMVFATAVYPMIMKRMDGHGPEDRA